MAYQDGSFPYGAPILTTAAGFSYVCNSFNYDKDGFVVQILNENGAPSGALVWEDFTTGTAEVQFANNNVPEPTTVANNATQGLFVNVFGANQNVMCTGVSITKPQRGPWLATLKLQKKINA